MFFSLNKERHDLASVHDLFEIFFYIVPLFCMWINIDTRGHTQKTNNKAKI